MRRPILFSTMILLVAVLVTPAFSAAADRSSLSMLRDLRAEDLRAIISSLASMGSRVTGYPGYYKASEYIEEFFRKNGLKVEKQKYYVYVPVDKGSYIEINGKKFKIYSLWPNLIQPSAGAYEGKLVYTAGRSLEDFDGKDLNGSIVVMELDSEDKWIDALNFGAKGIVFVGDISNKYKLLQKVLLTPLHAPRAYATYDVGELLKRLANQNVTVKLVINMTWEKVEAQNIIGVIEGSERADEVVIVTAHYDSASLVPALSPGADEASSIAALLCIARALATTRPIRTVWFVALSGHWQGLAGAREFIEEFIFKRGAKKIVALINLDFSSDTGQVSALHIGHFYKYGAAGGGPEIVSRFNWVKSILEKVRRNVLPLLGLTSDHLNDVLSQYYWDSTTLEPYMLDSEPACLAGLTAFSLMTAFARRLYWWTPFDTPDKVNYDNVITQISIATAVISEIVNSRDAPIYDAARVRLYGRGGPASYITLRGRVVYFNVSKGWYDPLPNALVRIGINPQANNLIFANIIVKSNSSGEFEVHGLPMAMVLSYRTALFAEAWYLDERGGIRYALDMGVYGARTFSPFLSLWTHPENVTLAVFECATIELFDLYDPAYQRRAFVPDPTTSGDLAYLFEQAMIMPYSLKEYSEPLFYGVYHNPRDRVALVFVQPRSDIIITLKMGVVKLSNVGVLANTSQSSPEGEGYWAHSPGERIRILFTALKFAEDMYRISEARYKVLSEHFVSSPTIAEAFQQTKKYIEKAKKALNSKLYSKAYSYALAAWSWALVAYDIHVMPMIFDLSWTTVLFYSLLLPFAFLTERLIIRKEGMKRLIAVCALGAALFVTFSWIHPSLALISNSALALAGVLILTFLILVTAILFNESMRIIEEESIRKLGEHTFQRIRLSIAEIFSSVALESMRRYKLRTILTMVTLFTITIAIVSLTSSSYALTATWANLPYNATYSGLLLKKGRSEPPYNVLDTPAVYAIEAVLEGKGYVTPRARLWPSNVYPYGRVSYIKAGNRTLIVRGFLGLTSEESKVLLERALIAGRALEGYDYYACILTDYQARSLGVNVGDTITVDGLNLTVVGIVSSPVLTQIRDLDDLALTPLDPRTLPQYAMAQTRAQVAYPLSYDETLILPYKLVMDLGGSIWSIAVHFKGGITPEDVISISTQLAKMLDVPVYVSLRNSVVGCSRIVTWSLMGWGFALIVLVMGSLNIITTFMSHVRERSKDIVIYSAVGLPPSGTVTMFLIESLVHLSIVIPLGYVLGVAFNYVLYLGGVIPSTYVLNFSSLSLALSLLAIISVIILSSLYPALAASHAITPSLERRWKIPTSPRGDTWEIPLPVTAASRLEAVAMIVYLREYLEGSGKVTAHYTVIDAPTQGVDTLSFTVLLSPRELNITQRVTLIFQEVSKNRYVFTLNIRRLTGRYETWKTSNYFFVDHVRKQLLLWRSLREESRRSYVEAAQALLVKHPKNI